MSDEPRVHDDLTVIVLAGGAGRRLGGPGKPALEVRGRTLLDHVLLAAPAAAEVVVVGPRRPTVRSVRWTREDPPGGGPVAGLAAGLHEVTSPLVMVLAADLPRIAGAVPLLLARARLAVDRGRDGAWMVDATGRVQPMVSCVRAAPLRTVMPAEPWGEPLHRVLAKLRLDDLPAPAGSVADVDTPDDLARVRQDQPRRNNRPEEDL